MKSQIEIMPSMTQGIVLTTLMQQSLQVLEMDNGRLEALVNEYVESNPLLSLEGVQNHAADVHSISLEKLIPTLTSQLSWREELREQARLSMLSPSVMSLVCTMIQYLDDRGYLPYENEQLCAWLGCDLNRLHEAKSALQLMEPSGIGARNLQECLLLQLRDHEDVPCVDAASKIVHCLHEDQVDTLKALDELRERLDPAVYAQAMKLVKTLKSRPVMMDEAMLPIHQVPDLEVKVTGEGELALILHDPNLERVIKLPMYTYPEFLDHQTLKYVAQKQKEWHDFKNILQKRHDTLVQVAYEILQEQRDFFIKGSSALRPLMIKTLAQRLSVAESTVSRAIMNKWIKTPHGLYPMRSLITGDTPNVAESIHAQIRALIDQEDRESPLSDQQIADELHTLGNVISRRTVAKYREQLGVLSAKARRLAYRVK